MPAIPGLEAAGPLTHIEALELDTVPSHLIVLGGGYVGLELAQAFRRFGSQVTVIEAGPQLMSREDPDVADAVQRILREEGVRLLLSAATLDVQRPLRRRSQRSPSARPAGEQKHRGQATSSLRQGALPIPPGSDLRRLGVELDARGYIRVNERLETTAPDVWAIGECAGSPQFTHVSVDDFRIIRDNLAGGARSTRRSAGAVLRVHRPAARPCRAERTRRAATGHCRARRQAADGGRAANRRQRTRPQAS